MHWRRLPSYSEWRCKCSTESRSILDYMEFHLRVCVHARCMYALSASLLGFVTADSTCSNRVGNKGFWSHKTLSMHFLGIRAGFLALYGHTLYTTRVVSSALVPYRALPPSAQCPSRAQCQLDFFFWKFSEIRCMTLENRREPKKKCGLRAEIPSLGDAHAWGQVENMLSVNYC